MDKIPTQLSPSWQVRDRFLELHSRWMTLICEHLQDQRGEILEYWRLEKADSVIVLPIQNDQLQRLICVQCRAVLMEWWLNCR